MRRFKFFLTVGFKPYKKVKESGTLKRKLFALLSTLVLLSLLLTACTVSEEKPRDQAIQMETWKYAMVTVGQDTVMSLVENATIKTMDGQLILPEAVKPGQTVLIENLDDEKLAVFAIIQSEDSTTIVKLVKPGHNKCPDWAGNLFTEGCESEVLPIIGDRK